MKTKEPIHILQYGMTPVYGGTEAYVINLYRNIDRSKVQFDFFVGEDVVMPYEDEVKLLGANVYHKYVSPKESIIKMYKNLKDILKEHKEIKGIEMNCNFVSNPIPLILAHKYKLPVVIYHAHNAGNMNKESFKSKFLSKFVRKLIDRYATNKVACSELAGQYMFRSNDFEIINNAIDTKKYSYNLEIRKEVRKELGLTDNQYVIGFIGRIQYQKNPDFIINIFEEVYKRDNNAVLVIAGDGDMREEIERLIVEKGLEDSVKMLGQRKDAERLYQGFDLFLLPSRFEGFPIVLIEAETSGLPCIISDTITKSIDITGTVKFLSINENSKVWADEILKYKQEHIRIDMSNEVKAKGFDIVELGKKMTKLYSNI